MANFFHDAPGPSQAYVPPKTSKPNGQAHTGLLAATPWQWRDPTTMPPRPWLLGTMLLRGYTTLLGSPGGVGKTTLAIAAALSVITGRKLLGEKQKPWLPGTVWIATLEDDRVELERRIAAAMLEHGIEPAEVFGKLIITEGPLKLVEYAPSGRRGLTVAARTQECDDVERFINDNNVVLAIIDPLVKAHSVNGNANEDMDVLISVANDIARETGCALLLPCHFRKGGNVDDDGKDAFRGASSLVDGARIAVGLVGMTKDEAEAFGVSEDDAGAYVRMVNSKANMTPKADATDWFELTSVPLGNGAVDPTYPNGDSVQAIRTWQSPKLFEGMGAEVMETIFARLGDPEQVFHPSGGNNRNWAGTVVMAEAGKSRDQAKRIIQSWIDSGTLVETTYKNNQRNDRIKLAPNPAKVAAILADLAAAHPEF